MQHCIILYAHIRSHTLQRHDLQRGECWVLVIRNDLTWTQKFLHITLANLPVCLTDCRGVSSAVEMRSLFTSVSRLRRSTCLLACSNCARHKASVTNYYRWMLLFTAHCISEIIICSNCRLWVNWIMTIVIQQSASQTIACMHIELINSWVSACLHNLTESSLTLNYLASAMSPYALRYVFQRQWIHSYKLLASVVNTAQWLSQLNCTYCFTNTQYHTYPQSFNCTKACAHVILSDLHRVLNFWLVQDYH